jgi:hypothetical protein
MRARRVGANAMQQPWRGHLARLAALEPLGQAKDA